MKELYTHLNQSYYNHISRLVYNTWEQTISEYNPVAAGICPTSSFRRAQCETNLLNIAFWTGVKLPIIVFHKKGMLVLCSNNSRNPKGA